MCKIKESYIKELDNMTTEEQMIAITDLYTRIGLSSGYMQMCLIKKAEAYEAYFQVLRDKAGDVKDELK